MRSLVVVALALALPLTANASTAPPPAISNQFDQGFTCEEGQTETNVEVATFTDTFDPSGPFTISIDWGDSTPLDTSSGTVVTPSPSTAPSFMVVLGTHTYAEAGSYQTTVTITDTGNSATAPEPSSPGQVTVNDAPLSHPSSEPAVSFTQDVSFTGAVGTFTDANPDSTASDFTASIDWNDGSDPTPGTITGSAGSFTVSGTHTYSWPRPSFFPTTTTIDVSVNDVGGSSTEFEVQANIASKLAFTSRISTEVEGSPSGVVAHFTDANLTDTVATFEAPATDCDVSWCSSGCDLTSYITGGNGQFDVISTLPHHTKAGDSDCLSVDYIYALDGSTYIWFDDSPVTVLDAPISATPKSIQVHPNVAWTGEIGGFSDGNIFAQPTDYSSAVIDWGDGTATTNGTIQRDGVSAYFSVIGTHTYTTPSPAPYTATVTVTDSGGTVVTIKSSVTVLDTILKVAGATNSFANGVASSVTAGSFTISDLGSAAGNFTATVDWGDGSTPSTGTVAGARGEFLVTGDHTYAKSGTFTTTLTVTDTRNGGGIGTATGSSIVTNGLLTVDVPGSIVEYAGEAFTWTFSFNDAEAGATASKYAISVDFGDSTSAVKAAVTAGANAGDFTASAGHTYAAVGDDTITVTINDAASSEVLAMVTVKVSVLAQGSDGGATNGNGNSSSSSCSIGGVGGGRASTTGFGSALLLSLFACAFAFRRRRA